MTPDERRTVEEQIAGAINGHTAVFLISARTGLSGRSVAPRLKGMERRGLVHKHYDEFEVAWWGLGPNSIDCERGFA